MEFVGDNPARLRMCIRQKKRKKKDKFVYDNFNHLINFFNAKGLELY